MPAPSSSSSSESTSTRSYCDASTDTSPSPSTASDAAKLAFAANSSRPALMDKISDRPSHRTGQLPSAALPWGVPASHILGGRGTRAGGRQRRSAGVAAYPSAWPPSASPLHAPLVADSLAWLLRLAWPSEPSRPRTRRATSCTTQPSSSFPRASLPRPASRRKEKERARWISKENSIDGTQLCQSNPDDKCAPTHASRARRLRELQVAKRAAVAPRCCRTYLLREPVGVRLGLCYPLLPLSDELGQALLEVAREGVDHGHPE